MAHEINNPLAIISASAQIIRRQKNKKTPRWEAAADQADVIMRNVDRIHDITKRLLSFVRQYSSKERVSIRLVDIAEDLQILSRAEVELQNVKFEIDDAPDVMVFGNPAQMIQMLMNLVHNASHAASQVRGGRVHIRFQTAENFLQILVTDNGPGLPQEVESRIFDPFFTTKAIGSGEGLGLTVAVAIAKEHGGNITLQSVPEGTCFEVRLPCTPPKPILAEAS